MFNRLYTYIFSIQQILFAFVFGYISKSTLGKHFEQGFTVSHWLLCIFITERMHLFMTLNVYLTDINVLCNSSAKYSEFMCINCVLLFAISCHDSYFIILECGLIIVYVLSHITFQFFSSNIYFSYQNHLVFVCFLPVNYLSRHFHYPFSIASLCIFFNWQET